MDPHIVIKAFQEELCHTIFFDAIVKAKNMGYHAQTFYWSILSFNHPIEELQKRPYPTFLVRPILHTIDSCYFAKNKKESPMHQIVCGIY